MEKQISRWACCGILLFLAAGCSSTGELGHTMNSWQGSHVDEVSAAWGEPHTCETVEGRRICSWYDMVSGFSLSTARTCARSLEIDTDGIVTGWRWRGDYCYAAADRVMARAQFERPDALAAESPESGEVEVAVTEPAERPAQDRNR